eukprot:44832_1
MIRLLSTALLLTQLLAIISPSLAHTEENKEYISNYNAPLKLQSSSTYMAYTYTIEKYNSHGLSNDVLLISRFNTKVQFPLLQDSYGEAQHELLNDYCGRTQHKSVNSGPGNIHKFYKFNG